MNISPVNYNVTSQNINFKGHKAAKEKKHIAAKTILAASALTAAAITGMIIAKKFPNTAILKKVTSPLDKNGNKTVSKFAAGISATVAATAAAAAVSTPEETKKPDVDDTEKDNKYNENKPQNQKAADISYSIPKQLTGDNEEKAQRLQDFIDEVVKSKVEPHVSELENIEPANLIKPTKEEVIELKDGNKLTKTTQYTKAHKIVNFVLEQPVNGVRRVEQIRHPNNKLSTVNIYDSTNKIKQTSAYKYNYESGKLIDITIYDKELGRRSKIKYVYNDNFTRLEKVVIIGADGRVKNITKLPLSFNKRLMHSLYSIQDGFSVAGDKISDSLHKFKKMAMF